MTLLSCSRSRADVDVLSSHEQVLGCSIPVGEALAAEGPLERYAVDFIARRFGDCLELQASGEYLRQGGTSAITSGNLTAPHHRGLLPVDLIDIVAEAGLHFDPAKLPGSVFHLLGCLSEYDKLSMTCIGRSAIAGALGQLLALQILRSNGLK